MKKCNKCGKTKELSEYYKNKTYANGYENQCKDCRKGKMRENYNTEYGWKIKDEYRKSENSKISQKKCESTIKRKLYNKNRDPIKLKARSAVYKAINRGDLSKPLECSECGKEGKVEAHHWSYLEENWLDIIWLCPICHGSKHKKSHPNLIE